MIRTCGEHGCFRGDFCPICDDEGKFMMSDYEVERIGKGLAGMLRHGKYDPDMDDEGYVHLEDVLAILRRSNAKYTWLKVRHIQAIADTDPKGRYQISGSYVRARYGHTIELNLNHPTDDIPPVLYYHIVPEELDNVLEEGIFPSKRALVHLSRTYWDSERVGSHHTDEPIILEIDAVGCIESGIEIGKATDRIYLCDQVPSEYIKICESAPDEDSDLEEDE